MNAFITGSRAYGTVKPGSDIDLVVMMDELTAIRLRKLAGVNKTKGGGVKFGNLNLIICTTEEQWAVWKLGTSHMVRDKARNEVPFDKGDATKILDGLRVLVGIKDGKDSGDK